MTVSGLCTGRFRGLMLTLYCNWLDAPPPRMATQLSAGTHHPKLVVIHTYGTWLDAELAIAALQDAGIPATIQADTAGGMRDHLAWSVFESSCVRTTWPQRLRC